MERLNFRHKKSLSNHLKFTRLQRQVRCLIVVYSAFLRTFSLIGSSYNWDYITFVSLMSVLLFSCCIHSYIFSFFLSILCRGANILSCPSLYLIFCHNPHTNRICDHFSSLQLNFSFTFYIRIFLNLNN